MSNNVIRIRFVALNDASDHAVPNIILYVKKLTKIPTSPDSSIKVHEANPRAPIILSFNETFDILPNDEYVQVLFIESTPETQVVGDIIFWRNYLIDLYNSRKNNKDNRRELVCNAPVEPNYKLQFNLLIEDFNKENTINRKKVKYEEIQGHMMCVKQFNQPVHCAICHKFIWGVHRQGCQCSQCLFVTHRKCHKPLPFLCHSSSTTAPKVSTGNRRFEFHLPHVFKDYESPFVRSFFSGDHSYCNHCGTQVLRSALKCSICEFIIHRNCEVHVPPMCGISYRSVVNSMKKDMFRILPDPSEESGEKEIDTDSETSLDDFAELEPLPNLNLKLLPKFIDFKFIGRLGSGGYAHVYCVQHIPSKEYVAIKVIDGTDKEARRQFETERQILFRYSQDNPYMIKPYCSFHQGKNLFMVMECVEGDTLCQKIHKTRMNESEIRFFLAEVISVLQYLHKHKIVYRDMKLEHIITSSEGHIRVVDYGLGGFLKPPDELSYIVCGTNGYMAPEILRLESHLNNGTPGEGYSYAVDYWTVGILFLQMLCGEQLDFHPEKSLENYNEMTYPSNVFENIQLARHISAEARSCLSGLLELDPKKRLGTITSPHGPIREHPFFTFGKEINWAEIDEGVFKCLHKTQSSAIRISTISVDEPLSTLPLDRGTFAKQAWMAAGESKCTSAEEKNFKSYDYITQATWRKFIPTS